MIRRKRLHLESSNFNSTIRRIATTTNRTYLQLYPVVSQKKAFSGRQSKFYVAKIGRWTDNGLIGYCTPLTRSTNRQIDIPTHRVNRTKKRTRHEHLFDRKNQPTRRAITPCGRDRNRDSYRERSGDGDLWGITEESTFAPIAEQDAHQSEAGDRRNQRESYGFNHSGRSQ